MGKKLQWYVWETIVLQHYLGSWWTLLEKNYTIPGGEIDLIMWNSQTIIFCEVKVVDKTDDLMGYITPKKLKALKKTVETYCRKNNVEKDCRLDVIFVKNWEILQRYEDIYF